MATSYEYIEYVVTRLPRKYFVYPKKMFGEYMIFIDEKPALLICDNTVFVKKLDVLTNILENSDTGTPYPGAKEHYILDIDDLEHVKQVVDTMLPFLKVSKKSLKSNIL